MRLSLNYPDTSKAGQYSFVLAMRAFPTSILYLVVLCVTGKIEMGLSLLLKMFLKALSSSRYFRITEQLVNTVTRRVKNTKPK